MREGIEDLKSCCRGFRGFEGKAQGWGGVLFFQIEFVGGYMRRF